MNAGPDVAAVINICRREKGIRKRGREAGKEQEKKGSGEKEKGIQVLPSFPGNAKSHCNQLVLSLLISISEVLN